MNQKLILLAISLVYQTKKDNKKSKTEPRKHNKQREILMRPDSPQDFGAI